MDPVHQDDDGLWYFWDEIWCDRIGPYDCEYDARVALKSYCVFLDIGAPDAC